MSRQHHPLGAPARQVENQIVAAARRFVDVDAQPHARRTVAGQRLRRRGADPRGGDAALRRRPRGAGDGKVGVREMARDQESRGAPIDGPCVLASPVHGTGGEHVLVADQHDVAVDGRPGGVEIGLGAAPDVDQIGFQAIVRGGRGPHQRDAVIRTSRSIQAFQHRLPPGPAPVVHRHSSRGFAGHLSEPRLQPLAGGSLAVAAGEPAAEVADRVKVAHQGVHGVSPASSPQRNSRRSVRVRRTGPPSVTSTVSLNATPASAEAYM